MEEQDQAPRPGASLLACAELRQLLDAARLEGTPRARLVELAILIPCGASQLAWAPVECIDRNAATIRVLSEDGTWCTVVAGRFGLEAIDAACGGRSGGPLIMDCDGGLGFGEDTSCPVVTVFGTASPGLRGPYGLLNLIRSSVLAHHRSASVPFHVAAAQGGEPLPGMVVRGRSDQLRKQAIAAQAWHGMLGLWSRPGGLSDFADPVRAVSLGAVSSPDRVQRVLGGTHALGPGSTYAPSPRSPWTPTSGRQSRSSRP